MPIADVRIHERMDRLVLTPRDPALIRSLGTKIREVLPGVSVKRSADGLWVSAHDSPLLLSLSDSIELKWSEEARQFALNRQHVEEAFVPLRLAVERVKKGGRPLAESMLSGIPGLEVLDDHQWVNVAAMTLPGGFGLCVFDEQGAGKTVTFIFAFDVLAHRNEADFALIVAPKSMVAEWPRDFERFKGDLYRVGMVTGSRREKTRGLSSDLDVVVTNFETAVAMEEELRASLRRRRGRAVLVVDESFFIKNLDTKRTRSLLRLREWCGRAFVLCGTPAPNAPRDLVQQFNIVDFGATFGDVLVPDDRESARVCVQSVVERKGIFVRHLKSRVLPGLPAKRFHRVILDLQPVQLRLYESSLKSLISDLRSVDDLGFRKQLTSFLAKRSALLQICSNPVAITRCYEETPAKLLALDSLLEEIVHQRGDKVVLWSFYTASLDALMVRYAKYNPVRYDGVVSDVRVRREAVRSFQEDDSTMVFVGNPAAAGAGLTLHRARIAIYESFSNQAAHYLQSLDRIHRRGQTREVEYLMLLCDKTIEVQEYDRLIHKELSAQQLLGDEIEAPATRESMLSEALSALRLLG
jgi:SNF2 family DNA or RNA helicase